MADEPDNLILRCLRAIDGKIDRLDLRMDNLEMRMTAQEKQSEIIIIRLNGMQSEIADCVKRLDRIERRLGLVDSDA